ncbi:MAG: cupredoxin domain-containing protein [Microthrixaceae bacterium]
MPRPPLPARRPSAVVVALLVGVLGLGAVGCGDDRASIEVVKGDGAVTHEYVIPFGTAQRLEGGEKITIVPQTLNVKVGDSIRIRNDDAYGSQVGIFHVGAGETVTMKFTKPGTLTGACDVHPSGVFTIDVKSA